jgi:hypothetical protein
MSRAVSLLFSYAIFSFLIAEVTENQNLIYYFSGLWLFFYGASFAIFYSEHNEIRNISQQRGGEGREESLRR